MSSVATAAVVGAYIAYDSAGNAIESSDAATAAASAASAAELAWAKEQQAAWEDVYGPTQDILAEYYNNLDADDVAAQNVQAIQKSYQDYTKQLDINLAQRGLDQSGLAAELSSQQLYASEASKAQTRLDAPAQVAQEQAGFLALGLGQEGIIQSNIASAYGSSTDLASQQAATSLAAANAASAGFTSSIGAVGTAIGNYAATPAPVIKT